MNTVELQAITVKRSDTFSLTVSNLAFQAGQITCITGPNGSGKTTVLECMSGLLAPDAGRVLVDGSPLMPEMWRIRRLIGIAPDDEAWLIGELTAREYLSLLAHTFAKAGVTCDMIANVRSMSEALYFGAFDQTLDSLSHGNKKKVQIMAALMHDPTLILVDELRNGLDPLAIQSAEALLAAQAQRGACIIASTHDLWWAERFAETILLIQNGAVVAHDKTADIVATYGSVEQLFMHHARANV